MMVTDIESLPRGGMGGVVHTVGTVENSEQKISQTKLILKCPLSREFAWSTYKLYFHLKGRQRCHQLPGWTRCRGTPHNNYQSSSVGHLCLFSFSDLCWQNLIFWQKVFCLHNVFPPFALRISNPILCLNHQQFEELVETNISNYSTWVISYQHINMLRVQTVQVINLK